MVVTRGSREDHEKKLFDVLKGLKDAGYRASEKKSDFFLNKTKWLGHEIDENGIKANKQKRGNDYRLETPEKLETTKIFSRSNSIP